MIPPAPKVSVKCGTRPAGSLGIHFIGQRSVPQVRFPMITVARHVGKPQC